MSISQVNPTPPLPRSLVCVNTKGCYVLEECRRQLGNTKYGYYVMKHMLNIVSANIIDLWEERFNNFDPFSKEEIDDVQKRWAKYLIHYAKW
ncbi:hypothetical protein L6164_026106 [Bauhinia variegata]|uniref:Uncharacterized protein n=1 Tax=Bauhinia variegata TaxID=167791 RepID=A0ACB9M4N2_BAUVA|nr:hypothetical protein L6164_026106 [Bauhinia variegata]